MSDPSVIDYRKKHPMKGFFKLIKYEIILTIPVPMLAFNVNAITTNLNTKSHMYQKTV